MSIEIKRSVKPVDYSKAINLLEERLEKVINDNAKELIWFLEHNEIYTAGKRAEKSRSVIINDIKAGLSESGKLDSTIEGLLKKLDTGS